MAGANYHIDMQVGARICELRLRAGFSADEASSLIGVPLENYLRLEAGQARFQPKQLVALAQKFGVGSAAIFDGVEGAIPSVLRGALA